MNRLLAAALGAVLLCSCVTSGDLRRIEDAQALRAAEIERAVAEYRSDAITGEELDKRVTAANQEAAKETRSVIEEVQERTEANIAAIKNGPITGNPILDALLTAGVSAGTAYFGVNKVRDGRRRMRGEPVAPDRAAPA